MLAVEQLEGEPSALAMVGFYAFVTASNGFVYVVNVDDDKYADFEDAADSVAVRAEPSTSPSAGAPVSV